MLSALLADAFQDGHNGIPIRYRFCGKLFNLKRSQTESMVQTDELDKLFFADDMAECASTEKMQIKVWIKMWIKSPNLLTATISQSASRKLKLISASSWKDLQEPTQ